jgi:hypothetical protein
MDLYSEDSTFNSFDYEIETMPPKNPSYSLNVNELEKILENANENFVYPITVIPNNNVFDLKNVPNFLKVTFNLIFLNSHLNTSFLQTVERTSKGHIKKKLPKRSSYKFYITVNIENKSANVANCNQHQTILFFHGNKCDIGNIFNTLIDISIQFKSDVISYDYLGYGQSEGRPCISTLENIEKISQYLEEKTISAKNLIIVGDDIGAVPAIDLITAEDKKFLYCKCLILLNPYFGNTLNEDKLKEIECNTFLIHYKSIKNIPYLDLKRKCENIKNLSEWYPNKLKWNESILSSNKREKFINKMKEFYNSSDKSFVKYIQSISMSNSAVFNKLPSEVSTQVNSNVLKDKNANLNLTINYKNNINDDYDDDI